jgi:hypothetical protein
MIKKMVVFVINSEFTASTKISGFVFLSTNVFWYLRNESFILHFFDNNSTVSCCHSHQKGQAGKTAFSDENKEGKNEHL